MFRNSRLMLLVLGASACAQTVSPPVISDVVVPGDQIVEALAKQFERFDLVGLGELHGSLPDHELRIKLFQNKRFLANVHNVVVEGLNSLYQEDLDRYIRGEHVPMERVQRIWRDSTQVFAGPRTLTAYELLLKEIRSVNETLPKQRMLRVIAADPPIDWTKLESHEEFRKILRQRVDFGAEAIEREVLRKGGQALLVFGAGHLVRKQQFKTPKGLVPVVPTIASLIDSRFPKRLYVVTQVRGASDASNQKLERLIGTASPPVLVKLHSGALSQLDPNEYNPLNTSILLGTPPTPFPQFGEQVRLSDVADAVVYRGPNGNPLIEANTMNERDEAYRNELRRRAEIAAPPKPKPQ